MNMDARPAGDDILGWLVVVFGTIATLFAIASTVYWFLRPGETDADHPKRIVLRSDR